MANVLTTLRFWYLVTGYPYTCIDNRTEVPAGLYRCVVFDVLPALKMRGFPCQPAVSLLMLLTPWAGWWWKFAPSGSVASRLWLCAGP